MEIFYRGIQLLIDYVYRVCGDYGIAIVLITVFIRLGMLSLKRMKKKGCAVEFIQLPIMLVLYNGIRLAVAVDTTTVLLPWVSSLLQRDSTYILPILTVLIQMIPQIFPYIGLFKRLNLTKMSLPMILILLFTNGWFAFMLPAGVELYFIVSGIFTAIEQTAGYIGEVKRLKTLTI